MACKNCKKDKQYNEMINSEEFKDGKIIKFVIVLVLLSFYGLYSLIGDIISLF